METVVAFNTEVNKISTIFSIRLYGKILYKNWLITSKCVHWQIQLGRVYKNASMEFLFSTMQKSPKKKKKKQQEESEEKIVWTEFFFLRIEFQLTLVCVCVRT